MLWARLARPFRASAALSNYVRLLLLLVLASVFPAAAAPPGPASDAHVLVLGRISDDPKAHYEQLKPLLDYVVPRMANVGIREGRILMARDAQQMTSYLRRGRVDWVTETSATAMLLRQRAGAQPLLLTERDGVSRYRTVFLARRDNEVAGIDALRGRSIAFQNPASTSAYLIPAAELLARGLPLTLLLSPQDRPGDGEVGYLFARSELNQATWVHKRLVDVAAMSNLDWENPARVPATYRADMHVVYETAEYPRALEMVRANLDTRVRDRLREVLEDAARDPDAREAMLRFFKTTRFLPIDAVSQKALDRMTTGVARVRAEVE